MVRTPPHRREARGDPPQALESRRKGRERPRGEPASSPASGILDALLPILTAWKLQTGGQGLVIPPMRRDGEKIDKNTPGNYLRPILRKLGLPGLAEHREAWYAATRHTFASHWVMAGGSIEKLSKILGHYSVVMTERYAHLRPHLFTEYDLPPLAVDLRPGSVANATIGDGMGTAAQEASSSPRRCSRKTGAAL